MTNRTVTSLRSKLWLAMVMFSTIAGCASADPGRTVEESNRKLVVEFYDRMFNEHDLDRAATFVADDYRQHNPVAVDGKARMLSFFKGFFRQNPDARARIVRSASDGDVVWLHVHATLGPTDRGAAVVDIFRVRDGKIVEHWDTVQPVPLKSVNSNTMF